MRRAVAFWPSQYEQDVPKGEIVGWVLPGAFVIAHVLPVSAALVGDLERLQPFLRVISYHPLRLRCVDSDRDLLVIRYEAPNVQQHHLFSLESFSFETDKKRKTVPVEDEIMTSAKAKLSALDTKFRIKGVDISAVLDKLNTVQDVRNGTQTRKPKDQFDLAWVHAAATTLQRLLTKPIHMLGGNAMVDLVATALARQIDIRLTVASSMVSQLRGMHDQSTPRKRQLENYVGFHNNLWLVLNDLIVGFALAAALKTLEVRRAVDVFEQLQHWGFAEVQKTLMWLNSWPVGLKFNDELGRFLGEAFVWFLVSWSEVIRRLAPCLPMLLATASITSRFGATMLLSLFSDLLSLFTFHLYLFYLAMTSIYAWHISVLFALFNLFRGKKYNNIRQRIEPSTYSVDQQLAGTILFTLSSFLFPTVLVFYLLFAAMRVAIIAVHAATEALLALLNHFTLFALMLRLKDPARLPDGLRFDLCQETHELHLKSRPVAYSAIIAEFFSLLLRLSRHYWPLDILRKLFKGTYINPIPRYRLQMDFEVPEEDRERLRRPKPVL